VGQRQFGDNMGSAAGPETSSALDNRSLRFGIGEKRLKHFPIQPQQGKAEE